jgi:hypothetical protein
MLRRWADASGVPLKREVGGVTGGTADPGNEDAGNYYSFDARSQDQTETYTKFRLDGLTGAVTKVHCGRK